MLEFSFASFAQKTVLTLALLVLTSDTAAACLADSIADVYKNSRGELVYLRHNSFLQQILDVTQIDPETDGLQYQGLAVASANGYQNFQDDMTVHCGASFAVPPAQANTLWQAFSIVTKAEMISKIIFSISVFFWPLVSWWMLKRRSHRVWHGLGWLLAAVCYFVWIMMAASRLNINLY